MGYIKEEIEAMCLEWVIQMIKCLKNEEEKIKGLPIIKIKVNRYLLERFQIRRKNERPVMCKNAFSLDIKKILLKKKGVL